MKYGNFKLMELGPENIELQNKIMEGATKAYKKLVVESAERNESFVITDKEGQVVHVPAKDLLKKLSEK